MIIERTPLSLSQMLYCDTALAIVKRQGNENITDGKGNCTELYYHVHNCDKCSG